LKRRAIFPLDSSSFRPRGAPFGLALRESLAWGAPTTRLWLVGRVSNANFCGIICLFQENLTPDCGKIAVAMAVIRYEYRFSIKNRRFLPLLSTLLFPLSTLK
jgi:hypothetical protein